MAVKSRESGPASARLTDFLARHDAVVLDVVPAAVPGGRRLVVGKQGTSRATYAVAVGHHDDTRLALDNEEVVLRALRQRLPAELRTSVPRCVTRVQVDGDLTGLVLTAVKGLHRSRARGTSGGTARLLVAVGRWLPSVWRETSGGTAPVTLGLRSTEVLQTRLSRSPALVDMFRDVQISRRRLAELEVPSTASHGCLCPRHVRASGGMVTGVDDWGVGAVSGDPLRDLGGIAVTVAAERLPEVVVGRTGFARGVRDFTTAGLKALGIDERRWRDVLLLAQLEQAGSASENTLTSAISRVASMSEALPRSHREKETES